MSLIFIRKEEERKQHEYEMKYYEGLKTIELYKRNLKNVTSNNLDLGELYEETNEIKKKKVGELATAMKLEYSVEIEDTETISLSFKIIKQGYYVGASG